MAKWLALLTLDHEVPGSNPAGGISAQDYTALHCTEIFIVTFHHIEIIYVERVAKHQIVTPLSHGRMEGGGGKLGGSRYQGLAGPGLILELTEGF